MIIAKTYESILEKGCPYCKGQLSVGGSGIPELIYTVDFYTCTQCQEVFEVHREKDAESSFFFSCNGIYVRYIFNDSIIHRTCFISTDESLRYGISGLSTPHKIEVPLFVLDFSNKEKLHNKLRVFLIFS